MSSFLCTNSHGCTVHTVCFLHLLLQKLPSCSTKAEEVTSSIGQAFEMAYQRFLETQKTQQDFEQLKEKVQDFAQSNKLSYFV